MGWLKEKLQSIFPNQTAPAEFALLEGLSAARRIDTISMLLDYETLVSQLPATIRPHNFLAHRLATQSTVKGGQCVDAFESAHHFSGAHSEELVSRFGLDPLCLGDAANAVSAVGRRYLNECDLKQEGVTVRFPNDTLGRCAVEREISLFTDLETELLYTGKKESGPVTAAIYDWLAAAAPYAPQLFEGFSASANVQGELILTYTGQPRDWSAVTASPLQRPALKA